MCFSRLPMYASVIGKGLWGTYDVMFATQGCQMSPDAAINALESITEENMRL